MVLQGWVVPVIIGGVFIILGLGALIWGKREEKSYYDVLTTREDLREFFSRWPGRPEPGALKAGGWIAIAVGVMIGLVGGLFGMNS